MNQSANRRSLALGAAALVAIAAAVLWYGLSSGPLDRGSRSGPDSSDPLVRFAEALFSPEPQASWTNRGTVYVPAYAGVRFGAGRAELQLAATLSIRNTSTTRPLNLASIDYYDSAGALVQRYLTEPIALKPLGAIEVFVEAADMRAGAGAHFLVDWAASGTISEPVIETLLVGVSGTHGYSFVSVGRRVDAQDRAQGD